MKLFRYAILVCALGAIASCERAPNYIEALGEGLSDEHATFVNERMIEVFGGKRASGTVRELTNFEWDKVCLYPPYFTHRVREFGKHPFYRIAWSGDEPHVRLVFSTNETLRMVVRITAGYDPTLGRPVTGPCYTSSSRFVLKVTTSIIEVLSGKEEKRVHEQFQIVE